MTLVAGVPSAQSPARRLVSPDELAVLARKARTVFSHRPVEALRLPRPVTWHNDYGDALDAAAGDWLISDSVRVWSCKDDLFQERYEMLPDGRFLKHAPARAVQMDAPFEIDTLEGRSGGVAGDWIFFGAPGEAWPVSDRAVVENAYSETPPVCGWAGPRSGEHRP